MKLTLGFSPCPNDTFIFDALIHHKIDTEGLDFDVFYDDVETLNQKAFRGELDITKLSYHAFAYAADKYVLLDAGSALGFGVGPLLICKGNAEELHEQLTIHHSSLTIGIPGKYTTANFLLSLAFPDATNKKELVFSDIENAVLDGRVDIGLIIHENRFTYQDKGLRAQRRGLGVCGRGFSRARRALRRCFERDRRRRSRGVGTTWRRTRGRRW